MEVNISKQIIDQRINTIMNNDHELFGDEDLNRRQSKVFLALGVAAYLNLDLSETLSYITDGENDGGIDAAYIEETSDGQVNVILFQSKYTKDFNKDSNFPANAVEKAVNTVKSVFDPSYKVILNEESQKKVDEIRSLILDGYIPYVTFVMLNNGRIWDDIGQTYIDNAFGNQEQVRFVHFGYEQILGYIEKRKPIDTNIKLMGASIMENFNYKRVIIGKVSISEVANLMKEHEDNLLDRNIRRYLGKNEINNEIEKSIVSDERANFFFYNNGITFVCDHFSYNALQSENWIVKTENLQIINGGQTCRTIQQTLKEHPEIDTKEVFVLVRIYEVNDDEDIVRNITFATNHQNPVDLRDLQSNDEEQIHLEEGAKALGYTYKRKRDNVAVSNAIPSTVAAEAVFSVWRKSPHLAKYKKQELFGMYYKTIFQDLNAAQMIIAVLVFRYCDSVRKKNAESGDIKTIRSYSNYFEACLLGQKMIRELKLNVDQITHLNFDEVKSYFDSNKEKLIAWAEDSLVRILYEYFSVSEGKSLSDIDGRTMAAAFRRFDIVERYIKSEEWWEGQYV